MPRLDPRERAGLPDRAFAYIDSSGRRRLPIHDPPTSATRSSGSARSGSKPSRPASVPACGCSTPPRGSRSFRSASSPGSCRPSVRLGQRGEPPVQLPSGFVTMLMTDIEGSTALVQHLGERYRELIDEVWAILRRSVVSAGGHEVEARADEFFAVFEAPRSAVDAAIADATRAARPLVVRRPRRARAHRHPQRVPDLDATTNYIGMDVHTASRITAVGHGGQVVVSANTREGVKASAPDGVRFTSLGSYKLRGLPEAMALYQVGARAFRPGSRRCERKRRSHPPTVALRRRQRAPAGFRDMDWPTWDQAAVTAAICGSRSCSLRRPRPHAAALGHDADRPGAHADVFAVLRLAAGQGVAARPAARRHRAGPPDQSAAARPSHSRELSLQHFVLDTSGSGGS